MKNIKDKLYSIDLKRKMQIEGEISDVLEKDGSIGFAYLFGSFIDARLPFHDIDLGIYFLHDKSNLEMAQAALELAVSLSRRLTFPVDVRVLNNAPVAFVYNVMKGHLICEGDENVRCRVTETTVRSYLDIRSVLYHATKEAFSHGS